MRFSFVDLFAFGFSIVGGELSFKMNRDLTTPMVVAGCRQAYAKRDP